METEEEERVIKGELKNMKMRQRKTKEVLKEANGSV